MGKNARFGLTLVLLAVLLASCAPQAAASTAAPPATARLTRPPLPTLIASRTPTSAILPTLAPSSTPQPSQTIFVLTPPGTRVPVKPSPTPRPVNGMISGSVINPNDPQRGVYVVAFRAGGETSYGAILPSSGSFAIPVPAGTYFVVAYGLPGPNDEPNRPVWAGGFTQAISCKKTTGTAPPAATAPSGQSCAVVLPGCKDHSLVAIAVPDGYAVGPLEPLDFTQSLKAYPPMPSTIQPILVYFPLHDKTPSSIDRAKPVGWIAGALSGPDGQVIPQRVVAYSENSTHWYAMNASTRTYKMELPPGPYNVVSYAGNTSAGYAACAPVPAGGTSLQDACGQPVLACRLKEAIVQPGQTVQGIDLSNWYPGPGRYPPAP